MAADTPKQADTAELLERLNQALDSGRLVYIRHLLRQMAPSDIAHILESSPPKNRNMLWQLIDHENSGEILEELGEEMKDQLICMMSPKHLAQVTAGMDTDDLAYVLRSLPDSLYRQVLQAMSVQDRARVEQALSYPEDTAGSLMNTDTVVIRPDVTIAVVLRYLRQRKALPEATDTLYVADRRNILQGGITLAQLLTNPPSSTIGSLMNAQLEAVPVNLSASKTAQRFARHDWLSAPVVNSEGKLLGRITVDDVVDVIREDAEHSMMGMAGMDDDEDTFGPIVKSTLRRTSWLTISLFSALLAASVSNMFEGTLERHATVAILMTIVPSMGGVAGNQTLALVIRGIALGQLDKRNTRWLVGKELIIGLLNGIIWAGLIFTAVWLWKSDITLALLIAGAILINLTVAGLAGASIPVVLKRLRVDPALAGSMVLTTITDVIGLFAFLGLATLFLGS
ncbi:magnesium transporter [Shewanella sp. YIC-542]|uniref:magnesium transporter n=1 Tax=Shewanella mytili TaxID=3377111 RepID=UPI00398EB307